MPDYDAKLQAAFYRRPTLEVARDLLGRVLVHRESQTTLRAKIVEVEAYHQDGDRAAHSFNGPTARNQAMFGPPGHLYVYFIYGVHHCINVVTEPKGTGAAVLIRAMEPLQGEDIMQQRRGSKHSRKNLTNGPGKLCRAMGIGPDHDGIDLCGDKLYIAQGQPTPPAAIVATTRIGISKSRELPWRFYIRENPFVSRR